MWLCGCSYAAVRLYGYVALRLCGHVALSILPLPAFFVCDTAAIHKIILLQFGQVPFRYHYGEPENPSCSELSDSSMCPWAPEPIIVNSGAAHP